MTAIIVDLGSGFVKAGLQTDSAPTSIFPTLIGKPRRRYTHLHEANKVFVGDDAIMNRNELSFVYPIDHGHIEDLVALENILTYTFNEDLKIDPSDSPILVTEPPFASSRHREYIAEVLFETFDASEINLSIQGVVALYASGRTTGLVIEIGDGVTQVVPVHDGFTDKAAIRRNDFGGQELTMYLQKLLCENGYSLTTRDEIEHVRIIKETLCYVALDPSEEESRSDLEQKYTLPDGMSLRNGVTSMTIGPERFFCCEALFEPRIVKRDNIPLHELIWQAAQASPIETRKICLNSMILSGGTSMFPGLKERLEFELKQLSPIQARSSVRVFADEDRLFGVWIGAKLFCDPSIRSMQDQFWVTKEEYMENGAQIVERKTPFRVTT